MAKSNAKSKVVVRQEKKLLLNAPEVSYFIACLEAEIG